MCIYIYIGFRVQGGDEGTEKNMETQVGMSASGTKTSKYADAPYDVASFEACNKPAERFSRQG